MYPKIQVNYLTVNTSQTLGTIEFLAPKGVLYIYTLKTLPIKVGNWCYRSRSIKPPPIKAPMTRHATIKGNSVLSTVKVIARITIAINHAINFHMITMRTMSFQLHQQMY